MAHTYGLYLVRHAIAADRGPDYPDDTKRPLTAQGIEKFKRVARGLAALDPPVELVLTSPLVRARQTAEILAQQLRERPPLVETELLAPGAAFTDLAAELGRHAKRAAIALVGHEPDLGMVAATLIGARGSIEFKKGGICLIEVGRLPPGEPGRLVWLAPPKMLSRLGD